MDGRVWACLYHLNERAPVLVLQPGRLARRLAVLQAVGTLGVEAKDPIANGLQADTADAGCMPRKPPS